MEALYSVMDSLKRMPREAYVRSRKRPCLQLWQSLRAARSCSSSVTGEGSAGSPGWHTEHVRSPAVPALPRGPGSPPRPAARQGPLSAGCGARPAGEWLGAAPERAQLTGPAFVKGQWRDGKLLRWSRVSCSSTVQQAHGAQLRWLRLG